MTDEVSMAFYMRATCRWPSCDEVRCTKCSELCDCCVMLPPAVYTAATLVPPELPTDFVQQTSRPLEALDFSAPLGTEASLGGMLTYLLTTFSVCLVSGRWLVEEAHRPRSQPLPRRGITTHRIPHTTVNLCQGRDCNRP